MDNQSNLPQKELPGWVQLSIIICNILLMVSWPFVLAYGIHLVYGDSNAIWFLLVVASFFGGREIGKSSSDKLRTVLIDILAKLPLEEREKWKRFVE